MATDLTVYITATADDKYHAGTGNLMDTLYWGALNGGPACYAGLRFQSVSIPQGATINSAHIHGRAAWNPGGFDVLAKIQAWATDDAPAWSNSAGEKPGTCTKTTAAVDYDLSAMTSGTWYQTPDISAVVQEIVNRAGWASGNDLAITICDDGSSTTGDHYCGFADISTNATYAAYIDINYTDPSLSMPLCNQLIL